MKDTHIFHQDRGCWRYISDLNWHRSYLLDRPNAHMSLWPLKANWKPRVIFEFVKGPAFAARQNHSIILVVDDILKLHAVHSCLVFLLVPYTY
jgi:hypothetical protein